MQFIGACFKAMFIRKTGFCRWSKGCVNPGPYVAWISEGDEPGAWFECTEPESADRPIYCIAHAHQFQQTYIPHAGSAMTNAQSLSLSAQPRRSHGHLMKNPEHCGIGNRRDDRALPTLLFCRRLIDSAIEDAGLTDPAGRPIEDALIAKAWIVYQPDHHDKEDFHGSFEWACIWLSLDISKERRRALSLIAAALAEAEKNAAMNPAALQPQMEMAF